MACGARRSQEHAAATASTPSASVPICFLLLQRRRPCSRGFPRLRLLRIRRRTEPNSTSQRGTVEPDPNSGRPLCSSTRTQKLANHGNGDGGWWMWMWIGMEMRMAVDGPWDVLRRWSLRHGNCGCCHFLWPMPGILNQQSSSSDSSPEPSQGECFLAASCLQRPRPRCNHTSLAIMGNIIRYPPALFPRRDLRRREAHTRVLPD
ncbi:hypothetical protein BKA56DRAFT_271319 [Ilyonectria sp. MPI-CAGE-AT-0026]|nr:hypothetical protein BKA56DRAFT_271319 [Ilyonectria sp. MPI-CAGE-AT-0026]